MFYLVIVWLLMVEWFVIMERHHVFIRQGDVYIYVHLGFDRTVVVLSLIHNTNRKNI